MTVNMGSWAVIVSVFAAGCGKPADTKERQELVARTAVAAESAKAAAAAALPATSVWDEPHLVERLVQAGLAPQSLPAEKAEAYWRAPVHAYRVGTATLHAFIYPDSSTRRRVTEGLDSLSAAPKGTASPYPLPRLLILQNNLAAVLVGGTERQQERVSLAIAAGLPGPNAR
jgi:hypothetical protein